MARIAGLRLRDRWADWHGAPLSEQSPQPRVGLGEARRRVSTASGRLPAPPPLG